MAGRATQKSSLGNLRACFELPVHYQTCLPCSVAPLVLLAFGSSQVLSPSLWNAAALQEKWSYWCPFQTFQPQFLSRKLRLLSLEGEQEALWLIPFTLPSAVVIWVAASVPVGRQTVVQQAWRHQASLSVPREMIWSLFCMRQRFSTDSQGQNRLKWKRAAKRRVEKHNLCLNLTCLIVPWVKSN